MCLIISATARDVRTTLLNTPDLLEDIFESNPDGIGAMFPGQGKLSVTKALPLSLKAARNFVKALPSDDRALSIHFRIRTHGDINLENVHPYWVEDKRVALMHNGILASGNAADPIHSDTWHYIRDNIAPMVADHREVCFNQAFLRMMERDITKSNRFVLMDASGRMEILNRKTGIEYKGVWFSNTYAWSPWLLIEDYEMPAPWHPMTTYRGSAHDWSGVGHSSGRTEYNWPDTADRASAMDMDLDYDDERPAQVASETCRTIYDEAMQAIETEDAPALTRMFADYPEYAIRTLLLNATFEAFELVDATADDEIFLQLLAHMQGNDATAVVNMLRANAIDKYDLVDACITFGMWQPRDSSWAA